MDLWMYILLGFSAVIVVGSIYLHDKPAVQEKLFKKAKTKSNNSQSSAFDESELKNLQENAEQFLEFDTIYKGMISFVKDPNYFTMAFGVNGVNISMYSANERATLKSGFMNILNTFKEDVQFLLQSRYVDLSKNFQQYKPIIDSCDKERELLAERIKTEKSEVIKNKMVVRSEKLKQRNNYARHIIDFFNLYTKESECIYIKIFVVIGYRVNPKGLFQKRQDIVNEAYNALANKVKIYREQFESIKLKTYELDSVQTANIMYSTMLKNESAYVKLEDAIKNGLLDLMVENHMEQSVDSDDDYKDEYEHDYFEEAAATTDED